MAFVTHNHMTTEQKDAIEQIHELLVNQFEWNPDTFEVKPADNGQGDNILIEHLDEKIEW